MTDLTREEQLRTSKPETHTLAASVDERSDLDILSRRRREFDTETGRRLGCHGRGLIWRVLLGCQTPPPPYACLSASPGRKLHLAGGRCAAHRSRSCVRTRTRPLHTAQYDLRTASLGSNLQGRARGLDASSDRPCLLAGSDSRRNPMQPCLSLVLVWSSSACLAPRRGLRLGCPCSPAGAMTAKRIHHRPETGHRHVEVRRVLAVVSPVRWPRVPRQRCLES
ncbi:hypothetical protein B0T11DRAFT_4723 [Plectosphaerella cucumerina]|uniref:Uncharacterized protein n=1 Tax=Plectosphaerella cucumerina TaxID=40658 RepID=A0A8K0TMI5_9PEZI|nr:hypothetical protein B0T11DRAFT_4723 [Plectosphaerella cucumerina]